MRLNAHIWAGGLGFLFACASFFRLVTCKHRERQKWGTSATLLTYIWQSLPIRWPDAGAFGPAARSEPPRRPTRRRRRSSCRCRPLARLGSKIRNPDAVRTVRGWGFEVRQSRKPQKKETRNPDQDSARSVCENNRFNCGPVQ